MRLGYDTEVSAIGRKVSGKWITVLLPCPQGKLAEVRRDLQKLKAAPNPSGKEGGRGRRLSRAEREKAEERLRRIIVRCDLYVQRHRMLKEMGIRGRRH